MTDPILLESDRRELDVLRWCLETLRRHPTDANARICQRASQVEHRVIVAERERLGQLRPEFDSAIGRLDRCLSEFLLLAASALDEADRQTIDHHADDLIGVGRKAIELLAASRPGAKL